VRPGGEDEQRHRQARRGGQRHELAGRVDGGERLQVVEVEDQVR
jgi:hypothetical protein